MAQTIYRDPRTFQDLLTLQGDSPSPPPQASSVAPVSTSPDTFTDPREQRLYEMLTKPQDQGAAPTVDKKSTAGSIFKILGDALSTYASIQGRMPGLETHSFQKYLANLERQQTDKKAYDERVAKANQDASLRGAEFLYTADEKRKIRSDEQAGREALKKLTIDQQELDRKQRADEAYARRIAEEAKAKQDHDWDLEMTDIRFRNEKTIAELKKKAAEGDDVAKDDKKALGPILGAISRLSMYAEKNLAEGRTTPEELNGLISQMADVAMLSPEARKVVEDHFNFKLGNALRAFHVEKLNKELAAGSPDARMAGPGILTRMAPTGNILGQHGP